MTEIIIELDDAREVMYEELAEQFSEAEVDETLEGQLIQHLTTMYDNRERLQQMEEPDGDV